MSPIELRCSFPLSRRKIEKVGLSFLNSKREHCNAKGSHGNEPTLKELDDGDFQVDINYLKSLDPKEWKQQDHYAVLGLEKARFFATDDDIRRAYRKMVLQHHPDKRKAKGENVNTDDDYFTCITKAYEILGSSKSRRAYDSADPEFDDSLPTPTEIESNFYETFNKVFNLNARWSERKSVPSFGDENSSREEVELFYGFWYDFKSWREFSYLDEEDKEQGQHRDERRWIEKENKAMRAKRKKEEMQRIRALVDLAYNNDKRIVKFKNEEKEKKLAAKRAKMDAAQAQKAEQERMLKEAQLAKEKAEKAEQKRIEQLRVEKEQMKKALKKERKLLRDAAKNRNYFGENNQETIKNMEGVEKICEIFSLMELQEINKDVEKNGKAAFIQALEKAESKIKSEIEEINNKAQVGNNKRNGSNVKETNRNDVWSSENVQLLIKAVNLFPAGTAQRWDVIASFINQHTSEGSNISSRDVLNKAKALQNSDFSKNALKKEANEAAFESFEKSKKDIKVNSDTDAATSAAVMNGGKENSYSNKATEKLPEAGGRSKETAANSSGSKAWTKEEQSLLEQAIKTYSISTPDRWDRIAECIPNRTKKECMRRVKELVDLVNSKKEAQQTIK